MDRKDDEGTTLVPDTGTNHKDVKLNDPIDVAEAEGPEALKIWIKKALSGDPIAQEAIYSHCMPPMERYIRQRMYTRPKQDAQEIIQSSIIALFNSLERFKGYNSAGKPTRLKTYAVGIANNLLRRYFSNKKGFREHLLNIEAHGEEWNPDRFAEDMEKILINAMRLELLYRILGVEGWEAGDESQPFLTTREHEILLLRYRHKLTNQEVAQRLSITETEVEADLNRVRERAEQCVEKHPAWLEFDPEQREDLETEARIIGSLVVKMIPGSRTRIPQGCKLSNAERRAFSTLFDATISPKEAAEKLGINRSYVDTLKGQIRKKANKARAFLKQNWEPNI